MKPGFGKSASMGVNDTSVIDIRKPTDIFVHCPEPDCSVSIHMAPEGIKLWLARCEPGLMPKCVKHDKELVFEDRYGRQFDPQDW